MSGNAPPEKWWEYVLLGVMIVFDGIKNCFRKLFG